MTETDVKFSSLFSKEQVFCGSPKIGWYELICELIRRVWETGDLSSQERACELILEKGRCSVSFPQKGIAVVHARLNEIRRLRLAIATSSEGFDYFRGHTPRIRLVVLVLTPIEDPASYLLTVSALVRICRTEQVVEHVSNLNDPEKIWKACYEVDERLPDYVSAGDIMHTSYPKLTINDRLDRAIDLFCSLGITEIPVVDEDGDLVGVVSNDELIRICLPEYITWMEDLSPILNFEPFAEILIRESKMPVYEIMMHSEYYAMLEEHTPAIQVAKIMLRRDVHQVYVVGDRRLVGIISIQDFINKVMRA